MATDEENDWSEAAAAFDDGKGLPLEEYNPDDNEDMQLLYQALKVNDPHAKKRLKGYIRSLRPLGPLQQQQLLIQQQRSIFFPEDMMKGLKVMIADHVKDQESPAKRPYEALSSGSYENDVHRRSATVDLQKRILALETQESRAVSYADYYAEKQAQGRINGWVLHPPAEINLPLALQVNLPGGGERDVVKPFWKNILNQNQLMRGLTNAYEVANLGVKTPDISFFQDHIDKPSAAEFVAYGDCKGSTWTGTSNAELGQVMLYAHRILDANPLRVHVYGFITNNQRVVLIKGHRQQERPFAVYWDISSPLAFQAGMSEFLYLLQNDNGYVMPPSISNSIVTIKKPLRPGGTCRAFTALYNSQEVVAKLYREVDTARSDASKIRKATQVMQDSTSDKKTALLPTVVAAEGRWLLITPVGIAFTASTLRLEHLEMILETLKIIHASNIVHRDVRFSNIFQLDGGGNVLLNDWGSSTEGGTLQMVQGCPEPWCHPDLVNVSEVSPETKHDLYSLVSSTANLLSPGLSAESHRVTFAEAFQAAEKADHDGVAQGFKAAGVKPS